MHNHIPGNLSLSLAANNTGELRVWKRKCISTYMSGCTIVYQNIKWPPFVVFSLRNIPVQNMFNFVHNYESTSITKTMHYEQKLLSYIGVNMVKCLGTSISRHCATSRRVLGSIPGHEILSGASDSSMCPGVDSASKNEYQDIPGGKDGRCVRVTTLPSSCAECLEILEP